MRKIVRHPSGLGSVISFDMYGKAVDLFVADPIYRTKNIWGEFDAPKLNNFTEDAGLMLRCRSLFTKKPLNYIPEDWMLQNRFPSFATDKTAKENTDIILESLETTQSKIWHPTAAEWCRKIEIEGIGKLDLPNIYELMVIFAESDKLDSLCLQAKTRQDRFLLGMRNSYGRFSVGDDDTEGYISSTQYSEFRCRYVSDFGLVGQCLKEFSFGVVPVKELSIR